MLTHDDATALARRIADRLGFQYRGVTAIEIMAEELMAAQPPLPEAPATSVREGTLSVEAVAERWRGKQC